MFLCIYVCVLVCGQLTASEILNGRTENNAIVQKVGDSYLCTGLGSDRLTKDGMRPKV